MPGREAEGFSRYSVRGDVVLIQGMIPNEKACCEAAALDFLQEGWEGDGNEDPAVVDDEELADSSGIFCRSCGSLITSGQQRIEVDGSHTHTFFNPAGLVFELGCFAQAPGCVIAGGASTLFTWFAGFAWRPASCARCGSHLGWRFEKDDTVFFSLILLAVTDEW